MIQSPSLAVHYKNPPLIVLSILCYNGNFLFSSFSSYNSNNRKKRNFDWFVSFWRIFSFLFIALFRKGTQSCPSCSHLSLDVLYSWDSQIRTTLWERTSIDTYNYWFRLVFFIAYYSFPNCLDLMSYSSLFF